MKVKYCAVASIFLLFVILFAKVALSVRAEGVSSVDVAVPVEPAPSLIFSSILSNIDVDAKTGRVKLRSQLQGVFFPEGSRGRVVLSRDTGEAICRWDWKLDSFEMPPPYNLIEFDDPVAPDGGAIKYSELKLATPGRYQFDFYLSEQRFYSFPFQLRIVEPQSRKWDEVLFLTDGAWNDWGYLYYSNAEPDRPLMWKIFMRDEKHALSFHKVKVEIVRDAGEKTICKNREEKRLRWSHDWVRQDILLTYPSRDGGEDEFFLAKDLLEVDGGYTLKMEVDGSLYGKWKFNVEQGRLNYTGRTLTQSADPLTFIDGGIDAWWYKREGS